jgi:hypothetical protein
MVSYDFIQSMISLKPLLKWSDCFTKPVSVQISYSFFKFLVGAKSKSTPIHFTTRT